MKKNERMISALVWLLGTLVFYGGLGLIGVFAGIMGTDSCHGIEEYAVVYLFFLWPTILLLAAVIPPALYLFRASSLAITLSLIGGFLVSVAAFMLYMPILGMACKPMRQGG